MCDHGFFFMLVASSSDFDVISCFYFSLASHHYFFVCGRMFDLSLAVVCRRFVIFMLVCALFDPVSVLAY